MCETAPEPPLTIAHASQGNICAEPEPRTLPCLASPSQLSSASHLHTLILTSRRPRTGDVVALSLQFAHLAALPLHSPPVHHSLTHSLTRSIPSFPALLTSTLIPSIHPCLLPHVFLAFVHQSPLCLFLGFPLNRDLIQTLPQAAHSAQIRTIHSFHLTLFLCAQTTSWSQYLGSDRRSSTSNHSSNTAVSFTPTPAHRYA